MYYSTSLFTHQIYSSFDFVSESFFWLLFAFQLIPLYYIGLQKKFPRINFQYLVSLNPAEYEYESHFFASRQDFPKFYDKGLKTNKIGFL